MTDHHTLTPSPSSTPTTKGQAPRLPLVVWVLALGTFLMGTTEFVVAGVLPEMASDLGVPLARTGLSITVFAIGMIVGTPTMAALTRRLSRRTTLVSALGVFAAGHLVAALTPSFEVLLGARTITAFATGAFWAIAAVVALEVAGPAAGARALAIVLGGGMLANILGVPAGSLLGQLVGWRGPFWALAALALLASVLVARTVPADQKDRSATSLVREMAAFRSPRLWLVLLTCALTNAGALSIYSFVAPLITERAGSDASAVPLALVAFGAAALLGFLLAGRFGDAHPYAIALTFAIGTLVFAVTLLLVSTDPALAIVAFGALGLTASSANPILVRLAVHFGRDAPTLASAMATSSFNAGTAVGSAVAGITLGTSAGPTGPVIVGIVGAATVLLPLSALAVLHVRTGQIER